MLGGSRFDFVIQHRWYVVLIQYKKGYIDRRITTLNMFLLKTVSFCALLIQMSYSDLKAIIHEMIITIRPLIVMVDTSLLWEDF